MTRISFEKGVEQICMRDPRYVPDAYHFVRDALDFTIKTFRKASPKSPHTQHVSGQELLEGIRRFALKQYGPMSTTLFAYWGIQTCRDFGEIVFNLVNASLFGKTDTDSIQDFESGYDFQEVFVKPFLPEKLAVSALETKPRRRMKTAGYRPAKKNTATNQTPKTS